MLSALLGNHRLVPSRARYRRLRSGIVLAPDNSEIDRYAFLDAHDGTFFVLLGNRPRRTALPSVPEQANFTQEISIGRCPKHLAFSGSKSNVSSGQSLTGA